MPIIRFVVLCCSLSLAGFSAAEDYPTRTIRLVVPFPPGSNVNLVARMIAQKLDASFGWHFVVDNKPGAVGTIANNFVAKSAPDGYVVGIMAAGSITATPHIMKVPYDLDDLTPVLRVASYESVFVVHPSVPAKTIKELVAIAKKQPATVTFGSSGAGNTLHLAYEQLGSMAGVKMLHVPYKGNPPILVDLIAGRIDSTVNSIAVLKPYIDQGKVRPLAVTGREKNPLLPGIPTVGESYPGYHADTWMGFFVPKGTPHAIVLRLNSKVTEVLQEPDMKAAWEKSVYKFTPNSQKEFSQFVKEEYMRYGALIKKLGLKPE